MTAIVLHTSERSVFQFNIPTVDAIEGALRRAGQGLRGRWVGPLARITRRAVIGDGFYTDATWVFEIDAGANRDAVAADLRRRVDAELEPISGDFTPSAVWDFTVAANGELSWWRSGAAANESRSRIAPPELLGRLDTEDNPIGPTTAANSSTSGSDILGGGGGTQNGSTAATIRVVSYAAIAVTGACLLAVYVPPSVMPWNWRRHREAS